MTRSEFVYVSYINSTPENVWNALLDNRMVRQYWGRHKNVSDWKVGSIWLHQDYDSGAIDIDGRVVEVKPPKRLVLTWEGANDFLLTEKPSRVTFEIEPFRDSTRLRLIHSELEPESRMLDGVTDGWPKVLSSLKSLLETGHALQISPKQSERAA
jgi:uncharacterized protein YndB with AHSA1/START domain